MEVILLKKNYVLLVLILFTILTNGCTSSNALIDNSAANNASQIQKETEKEITLDIVTTNKLNYYMVKDIVNDKHFVDYMFSTKSRIWDYNYSEDALNNISKKDLFFYSGTSLEPWSTEFIDKLDKGKVSPINISRGTKLLSLGKGITYKETTIKDNPYYWMNIDNYKIALLNIKNSIQDKDTKNRDIYEKNFNLAITQVEEKQKKLKEVMDKLKDYTFLVDGDELDYFTSYYGLKTIKIYNYNTEPSEENSAKLEENEKKLADLNKIIYIYDNEEEAKVNKPIIDKFKLKTLGLTVYKDNIRYTELLESNIVNLNNLLLSN